MCLSVRACGRLMLKSLTGCWPNIRLLNVSKVLHCKSYTSIIKVTNLLLSLSPLRNLPVSSSLSSPFLNLAPSLPDSGLMSYINTIPMEKARHGTDMVQTPVLKVLAHRRTLNEGRAHHPSLPGSLSVERVIVMEGGEKVKLKMGN